MTAASATRLVIADDHPLFRDALRQAVASVVASARIDEAGSFEELTALLDQDSDVDLVLLDLTMPRMDGEETLNALRTLNPNLPVILTSGYTEPAASSGASPRGANGFIQKPYLFDQLSEVVRKTLSEKRPPRKTPM